MDAAEHVIKSKADIRQVLIDYDQTSARNKIFGTGKAPAANCTCKDTDMYRDLGPDGSPIVMHIEMNKELNGENQVGSSLSSTHQKKGNNKSGNVSKGTKNNGKTSHSKTTAKKK